MDQILNGIGQTIGDFFASPIVQLALRADRRLPRRPVARDRLLGVPRHAAAVRQRDPAVPRRRPGSSCSPRSSSSSRVWIYKIIRPHEKIGEVWERNLAEEALLAEVEAIHHCPTCERRVNDEWIICPTCRTRLNRVCPNCSRLVGLDWSLCAWCGKDFERREVAAAAADPSRRRSAAGREATGRIADARGRAAPAVDPDRGPRRRARAPPSVPSARRRPPQDALPER